MRAGDVGCQFRRGGLPTSLSSGVGCEMRTFSMRSEARSNITPKQKRFLDAAARGHNRIVKALLEAGVAVSIRDGRVGPPTRPTLMHAAKTGPLRAAELLIQAGFQEGLDD